MIQNEDSLIRIPSAAKLGAWPGKSPPLPKRKKAHPRAKDTRPISRNTPRQGRTSRSSSARSGAATRLAFGASSWMEIAFPQSRGDTSEVTVDSPEGR